MPPSPHRTPPRRSTRGIPIASPSPTGSSSRSGSNAGNGVKYVWQGAELVRSLVGGGIAAQEQSNGKGKGKAREELQALEEPQRRHYTSFLRITDPRLTNPSTPTKARSRSRTSAAAGNQHPSQLRFSLGDGVLVACAGNSIGIGVLVGMWEEVVPADSDDESDEDVEQDEEYVDMDTNGETRRKKKDQLWEKMCEIRWCYRRQDLPNTMGQMKLVDHEILYSSSGPSSSSHSRPLTTTLPLPSLIHTCTIITSERFKTLYPMWHGDWGEGWAYVRDEDESVDGEEEEEGGEGSKGSEGDADGDAGVDAGESDVNAEGADRRRRGAGQESQGKRNPRSIDGSTSLDKHPLSEPANIPSPSGSIDNSKPRPKAKPNATQTVSKASPPTLSLSLSFSSFNPHRRPIPIVYYLTRALDKFGKGGEGKSWWWVDWEETVRRGREEGDWGVVVDRWRKAIAEKVKGQVAARGKAGKLKAEKDERAGMKVDEESGDESHPEGDYKSGSESEDGSTGQPSEEEDDSGEDGRDKDPDDETRATPRKRKRSTRINGKPVQKTPRKRPRMSTGTTPHKTPKADRLAKSKSKRDAQKTKVSGISNEIAPHLLPKDPYERSLHLLHVGATPDTLPCREEEFVDVLEKVEEGVEGGGGGCLYIAGVPGTGKTATVHAVIKQLRQRASDQEIPPFTYVEINGLKVPTPQHAYNVLWEAISGQKSGSAKTSLRELETHFREAGRSGPRGHTTVVLMDELDQLLTAKQDVVYNFFNWPTMRDSHLYVIAVANRMDLPQFLASKVKSRLGLQSLLFQPYDKKALVDIVQSRLISHPADTKDQLEKEEWKVLTNEAIELAAAKMAGTNGDARRVLDACRRAVETGIELSKSTGNPPKPVTIREMSAVLKAMTSSPIALFMKQCSLHQKMMMAAMLRCIRREGMPEITWRAMRSDHDNLLRAISDSNEILTNPELFAVFTSLLASHALTFDAHEKHKSMEDRKLALGMDANEVGRVLMGEGERWSQVLAGM